MRTAFSAFFAFWLVVLSVFLTSMLKSPFDAVAPYLPAIILLSVVATTDGALRFTAFVGAFLVLLAPSAHLTLILILILVAITSGLLYRSMFSAPTTGALLVCATIGSIVFELVNFTFKFPEYFSIGFPAFAELWPKFLVRLSFTVAIVLIGGYLYYRIALRFKRAFVGNDAHL